MNELFRLSALIKQFNEIGDLIASLIGRPAEFGHIGEYVASKVFIIALVESAAHKSIDGYFAGGALVGRSVNIKWYAKWEGLLDITPHALPDFYLVLTGPKSAAISSRGTTRPKVIEYVFLFDAAELVVALTVRKVKIGVATSVVRPLWLKAEVYPTQRNPRLVLSEEQRHLLALFR
jgi:hypothetical protein